MLEVSSLQHFSGRVIFNLDAFSTNRKPSESTVREAQTVTAMLLIVVQMYVPVCPLMSFPHRRTTNSLFKHPYLK